MAGKTNRFIWYELMTTDLEAGLDFYRSVVGWTTSPHPGNEVGGRPYMILEASGQGVGGAMQLTDEMCAGGARAGWVGYIGVDDTDATAQAIEAAGGRILMAPDDIPGVGRFAMVTDPGGAPFYLLTPRPPEDAGEPTALAPMTPGRTDWHELYTSIGQAAAFDFYSAQFGWETIEEMDMGPMGKYRIFGRDGEQLGGMMDKPDNVPASAWAFYFAVDALDAAMERAKAKGATLYMGPMEVPGGSWVCQGFDPQGASFSLVAPTR